MTGGRSEACAPGDRVEEVCTPIDDLMVSLRALSSFLRDLKPLINAVSKGVETPVQHADPTEDFAARHLREHRMGRPPKIESDAELQEFIRSRVATRTFVQIAQDVAAAFPAERRVGMSTIHRWWQRQVARA